MSALAAVTVSVDALKEDPSKFKHFTGLRYDVSSALLEYLAPKAERLRWWRGTATVQKILKDGTEGASRSDRRYSSKLSVRDQFFFAFVCLRTGHSVTEMSHSAGISSSTFSKMFTTWINFLCFELKSIHKFPSSRPRVFIKAFAKFLHTRIVIDCTEVFT